MVLRSRQCQVFVYRKNLSRSSILRTQTITSAYDKRSIFLSVEAVFYVKIQRFAVCTRFFCTVKNCNAFCSLRYSCQEMFSRERTIQVYRNQTNFFAVCYQVVDSFTSSFSYRTHSDDYAFSIFSTIVVEQAVVTSCNLIDFVHIFFYDSRNCIIERIARFSVLEEVIRVFSHTASNRFVRTECTFTEFSQSFLVYQRSEVFVFQHFNLLDFV